MAGYDTHFYTGWPQFCIVSAAEMECSAANATTACVRENVPYRMRVHDPYHPTVFNGYLQVVDSYIKVVDSFQNASSFSFSDAVPMHNMYIFHENSTGHKNILAKAGPGLPLLLR
ncbi:hypothetical protein BGZ75_010176, partial [Mortierella antarctica]